MKICQHESVPEKRVVESADLYISIPNVLRTAADMREAFMIYAYFMVSSKVSNWDRASIS